jgi:NSS family neurotransmitter:Na+ symporter
MPVLFIILLILFARVLTLPGAEEGLKYMISFDMHKVSFQTILSALGQAFYSLSIGMAIMITFGSYLPKSENIVKNAALVCSMDTLVAVLAGFIIVPAVFATLGSDQIGKGGGFAFVSLAGVFQQMPGGRWFAVLFYLLLLFAALTSCISLIEGIIAFLTERFNLERKKTTIIIVIIMFLIGVLYTSSQAAIPLKGIWVDGANGVTFPNLCDAMEYLTDRLMIPVCALGTCIFAGWVWKPKKVIEEVEECGEKFRLAPVYSLIIKYLAPVAILTILVMSIVSGVTLS